jgi:urease accessory protein
MIDCFLARLSLITMDIANAWHGQLDLKFHRIGDSPRTTLARSYARAPLKVQRPFYPEPDVCQTVLLHSAGGMVGGDRLSYHIDLAPASRALITTAAAAKIYRSQGPVAQQQLQIQVGANACLEWLPQETIIFNAARYQQDLRVELSPGGVFCAWDIVRLGRSASQETFDQGCWQNSVEVWQGRKPLWIDRQRLAGEQWNSLQAAASQPILGLLAIVGVGFNAGTVAAARSLGPADGQWGVTTLQHGLVCRYRGGDRVAARQWFIAVWDLLRHQYLGRAACIPRVWQL